ncbi:MAG: Zn-dependent alcohol dehydrogenase [Pseudomonadota bacterium]
MARIRAAVCYKKGGPLSIEDVELRDPVGQEVEVTLGAVAICHSDISYLDGAWEGDHPAIYGHEAAGRITALGPDAQGFDVGDHVVVTLIRACQTCAKCASGKPTQCATPGKLPDGPIKTLNGAPIVQAMNCGAFAEKVVVDQSQIARVPTEMPAASAALLACGVITGMGAVVNTARVRPGDCVVVIGAGGIGLNAIQGARIAGAARIFAIDTMAEKLDAAIEFGATDGIPAGSDRPWDAVQRAAGRLADAVFVSVGAIPAFEQALNYVAPGGSMYMVGMPHDGAVASYEPVNVAGLSQGMQGTKMGDTVLARDIPWMVELYGQGRLKLDELISGRWRLDQINEAIDDTRSGAARRNVIVF